MKFLLQKDCEELKIENEIVKDLILDSQFTNKYIDLPIELIPNSVGLGDRIPVGSIDFVTAWLKKCRNIDKIHPMEIPECLRTAKFLKRYYQIMPYGEIPRSGKYFVKDATDLKEFVFLGNVENMWAHESSKLDPSHIFLVSECVDIFAEYRVYFIDGEIENVCNYDGHPDVPMDFSIVREADAQYKKRSDYPGSYVMDMMVTRNGTSIIEMHPFVSVGLYSTLWGVNLLGAYKDGIEYIEHYNKPVEI